MLSIIYVDKNEENHKKWGQKDEVGIRPIKKILKRGGTLTSYMLENKHIYMLEFGVLLLLRRCLKKIL